MNLKKKWKNNIKKKQVLKNLMFFKAEDSNQQFKMFNMPSEEKDQNKFSKIKWLPLDLLRELKIEETFRLKKNQNEEYKEFFNKFWSDQMDHMVFKLNQIKKFNNDNFEYKKARSSYFDPVQYLEMKDHPIKNDFAENSLEKLIDRMKENSQKFGKPDLNAFFKKKKTQNNPEYDFVESEIKPFKKPGHEKSRRLKESSEFLELGKKDNQLKGKINLKRGKADKKQQIVKIVRRILLKVLYNKL